MVAVEQRIEVEDLSHRHAAEFTTPTGPATSG